MVSALFTAFAMIAAGQVEPANLDRSAGKAHSEWLAELEAEFATSTTRLIGGEGPDRQPR
jgi:hypothetical protein